MNDEIKSLIQDIWLGINVQENVSKLKKYGSLVLDIMLGFSEEKIEHEPDSELPLYRQPYEAYGDINYLITEISMENKRHYLELLKLSSEENRDSLFVLTWVAGPLGFEESIDYLIKGLRHEDKFIRYSCCESLKYFYDMRIRKAFIEALKDRASDVRVSALVGLDKYQDKSILPFIRPLLNDKYAEIRNLADTMIKNIEDL